MKKFIFYNVLRKTHAFPFLAAFLFFYFIGCFFLWILDGQIENYFDALWLGFNIVTSIGLGDYTVTNFWARTWAVVLGLYGGLIVAFIPSLVVSYYMEKMVHIRTTAFQSLENEIKHLKDLSNEQKRKLAQSVQAKHLLFQKSSTKEHNPLLKSWELFFLIFKQTYLLHFTIAFLFFFVAACILIWIFDPSIQTLANAFWFGFMIITTIGFGDFTVTHWTSRLVTVALGVYGIFIIAFVCGVIASYFFEIIHIGQQQSISQMIYQLEHLDQLTEDQLDTLEKQLIQNGLIKQKN